jgi:hypothetical protein
MPPGVKPFSEVNKRADRADIKLRKEGRDSTQIHHGPVEDEWERPEEHFGLYQSTYRRTHSREEQEWCSKSPWVPLERWRRGWRGTLASQRGGNTTHCYVVYIYPFDVLLKKQKYFFSSVFKLYFFWRPAPNLFCILYEKHQITNFFA